jgi:hypothetical protein
VLEYSFDRNPKPVALEMISRFVAAQAAAGVPLYLLSDIVEDEAVAAKMKELWGVEPGEIQAAFGPGRLILLARGETGVYLFEPATRRPELYAGLSFSALVENEQTRLVELVGALREVSRVMSPAERRRAAELLTTRNWGFDLVIEGFVPVMNAESRARMAERRAQFAEFQKTPDFWLKAGNLHKQLGFKAETLTLWTKAQRMSGDQALARQIEAFRKSN